MTKNISLTLSSAQSKLGQIKVAPRVLKVIASIAASQVRGVKLRRGSFKAGVNQLLGNHYSEDRIKLSFNHHQLVIDVYVYLDYGVSVPQVAAKIQDKVKQQMLFMTDLTVARVNVHVNGIIPSKFHSRVNPNNLFNGKDERK